MSYTLEEVSERTGKTQENLRKLIQRGRLRAEKEGVRTFVSQEALEDFVGGELLDDAADEVRLGNHDAAGVLLSQLPKRIKSAISNVAVKSPLDSLPKSKDKYVVSSTELTVPIPQFRPAPKPGKKK